MINNISEESILLSNTNSKHVIKDNNKKKSLSRLIINLIGLISSISGFYLYYLSLEGCYENTQTACLVNLSPEFFNRLFLYLIIASSILSINVFVFVKRKISIWNIVLNIIVYIGLFKFDTGDNLAYHGSYNKIIFLFCFLLITFIIVILYYVIAIMLLTKKQYIKLSSLMLVSFIMIYLFNKQLQESCENWKYGLNKESIDNTGRLGGKCVITSPTYCWQYVLDGFLDVSWLLQEDCNQFRLGEKRELFKYLNQHNIQIKSLIDDKLSNKEKALLREEIYNKVAIVAYPNTANWPWFEESYLANYQRNVLESIKLLDENKQPFNHNRINSNYQHGSNISSQPISNTSHSFNTLPSEVLVRFDKENQLGKVEFQIERNNTLIQERKNNLKIFQNKILNKNSEKIQENSVKELNKILSERKNILIVYIDCISRVHFVRKMKKTVNFIEKFYKTENTDFSAYQFLKYHQFHVVSPWGTNPMFFGQSIYDYKGTQITYFLKKLGYITAQANNICTRDMYDLEGDEIKGINFDSYDHELSSFFCDPNFVNPENPYTPYLGPYSIKKRCLYGKNTFEYVLDYSEAFWKAYVDQPRFLRMAFQDAHEGTGEVTRYLDDELSVFLQRFYSLGLLKNTNIVFVSDHGNKMIGLYQLLNCDDFMKEGTLGALFLVIPKDSEYELSDSQISSNMNLMITPYDLFPTILEMGSYFKLKKFLLKNINQGESLDDDFEFFNYEYNKLSSSLFKEVPRDRDCDTFSYDMKKMYCRCDNN
jgi:hypothetical protein